jgi:hypothetical protein
MAPFRLDRDTLERLINRYEAQRTSQGMGSMLRRVSPAQRIDALHICIAAYDAGRVPDGDQRDFWLAHLRPVLAETREAAAMLRQAFDDVTAEKREASRALQVVRTQTVNSWRRLFQRPSVTTWAAIAAILIAGAVILLNRTPHQSDSSPDSTRRPVPRETTSSPTLLDPNQPRLKTAYERFLRLTLMATARYGDEITPYALAATLAGAAPELGEPSFVLAAMMRAFPLPPAASIPHSPFGAMALRHYAALAAAASTRASMPEFDEFILNEARLGTDSGYDPAARLREFAVAKKPVAPASLSPETWPPWLRYLPLLALLPGLAWAFWGSSNRQRDLSTAAQRAARIAHARFRRAQAGTWGTSSILQSATDLPPLPAASQTARRLLRLRETMPGSRIDIPRSIRDSLASAGDVVTVMRDGTRAVDIVFIIRRRHRHDHERARMLRMLSALTENGVSLTAYDYTPDPRTLTATSRADANTPRGVQRTLDLRGLRELHGDSLLVIVSDGEELIDPFSLKPHHFVREELQLWSRRMLLTPVPIAVWGEREMTLAAALNAPVGRATLAGLGDLAWGLLPDALQSAPRRILETARRRPGFFERTQLWSAQAGTLLSPDDTAPPPALIERMGIVLLQELAPPDTEQKRLLAELKSWLGPGFLWFAACGIYPELRVDLTLWLGTSLHRYGHPSNPKIFSEDLFNRLCILPWFRACHMPEWLRTAAFSALSQREKEMAYKVISELVAGEKNQSGNHRIELQVWQPDWRGQRLSPDNVMVELKFAVDAAGDHASEAEAARTAWRRWLIRGAARAAIVAAWAGVATWLMPAFQLAPLPAGAWWPVLSFGVASVGLLAIIAICEFVGLFRLGDIKPALSWQPVPSTTAMYK